MTRRLSALCLLSFAPLAAAADKITFDDHILPVFQQSCLNCHNPDKAKGGLDLSTFSGTMKGGSGGKIVEPGDISSKMLGCVLQTATPKMPPEGEKLAATQIDLLKQWIEGGLLENKNSSARKPSKPKFETALRSDPAKKPDGPPPLPVNVLLEPPVVTEKAAAIHAIALSPWAPLLAVTGQRQVLLHDANTLELVGILPFPEGDPVSLAFSPDARYLIVGGGIPGKSGVSVTFDVTNGSRLLTAAKEFDSILAADIKPGFDIVATGGPSKLLKLWKTETGEQLFSVKKHTDWITALDISNDGVLLASGDRNGGVYVWETDTASEYQALRGHQSAITSLAFRADSNLLATASEDGTVRMWEMNGGSEVKKIDAHGGGVTAFAFARDGSFITAGRDKKAKLWKADFSPLRDLAGPFPALPTAAAFDPEINRAFVADAVGGVRVFETNEGKLIGEILANPPAIETRLKAFADRAARQQQTITAAEATARQSAEALDQARKALAEAEKNHAQSIEIHRAASTGAEKARESLEALQRSLQQQRDEITKLSAEKSAARTDLEAKKQALAALPENQRDPAPVSAAEQKLQQLDGQLSKAQTNLDAAQKEEPSLKVAYETAAKTAGLAQARLQPAEAAIAPARQALAAAEKSAADTAAAIETAKAELPKIHSAEKHWSAAIINAHALQAARQAEQSNLESEGELDTFSAATLALQPQAAALNAKRDQQQQLSACLLTKPGLGEAFKIELSATIAALEISIDREAAALRKLQNEALAVRSAVEQKIPLAHQALAQANQLKQAYEKARQ